MLLVNYSTIWNFRKADGLAIRTSALSLQLLFCFTMLCYYFYYSTLIHEWRMKDNGYYYLFVNYNITLEKMPIICLDSSL